MSCMYRKHALAARSTSHGVSAAHVSLLFTIARPKCQKHAIRLRRSILVSIASDIPIHPYFRYRSLDISRLVIGLSSRRFLNI
ncbi:hypothetical protein PNOK_0481100 [Pyrrhoderma noxium]|uniref:Uncharacterized protein n=1 Tax=Pyrrhoderma noxium TaxID=2282107 RepID=A0A286UJV6_9AGAM|nr:hypothetical protein PNOK_0481100 [Pyrrhoderma noxium]